MSVYFTEYHLAIFFLICSTLILLALCGLARFLLGKSEARGLAVAQRNQARSRAKRRFNSRAEGGVVNVGGFYIRGFGDRPFTI
jgi:hypothetical protein